MKTIPANLLVAALCLMVQAAQAQTSQDIVGYINRPMRPGVNLVANQLLAGDNTLNTVFIGGAMPDGTTFTKWSEGNFLPTSVYNAARGDWSINYTFTLGEGGWVQSPSAFTHTFVGQVGPYIIPDTGGLPWTPGYGTGLHLVSSPAPLGGSLTSVFYSQDLFAVIVGRAPAAGESVWTLDELTQTYLHATFDGLNWDNNLSISVGQAAWFDLGATGATPPVVPEPSTLALIGIGAALCLAKRRRR
jgi:hypothetical protein